MSNEVHVLFDGYSYQDPQNSNIMKANCTCTLIKGKNGYNVIVDTMTSWDRERIIEALAKYNVDCKDIRAVVCTHGHADHIGNNNLFRTAEWHFVGQCPSRKNDFYTHNFDREPFQLTDDIKVISSPGHTLSCVSVIVENTNLSDGKTIGICGDLFERMEDIEDSSIWLSAGSENPVLQEENRLKLANMVDFIIPGHGPGFHVTDVIKEKLIKDFNC